MFWKDTKEEVESSTITPYVEEEILKNKPIKMGSGFEANKLDKLLSIIGFIYDLNFKKSFEIIKEQNYINRIINRFDFTHEETSKKMENIKNRANDYIESKIKNNKTF